MIRILHLEDNPLDSELVRVELKKGNLNFEYLFADNELSYCNYLNNREIDVILSDYHLPDYTGKEALLYAKRNYPLIPFVFLSGTMGEDAAIESLLNGATDYVLKNNLERLLPAIHRAYKEAQEHKARRVAENQLRKLSRAVEQSTNSIIITDLNGIIEYVNQTTISLTGYSFDELIGNNPRIFSSGEMSKEAYAQLWNTILSEKEWSGEMHNKKKNGELHWESVTISPIFDENNQMTNFLAIKKDISESKRLTFELIQAKEKAEESDRLKSAFLANMSHEIRTPMNGILGFAELLKTPDLTGDQQQDYIRIIEKSGVRMLNIINDIVDISKIESGQMIVSESGTIINEQTEFLYTFFKPEVENKGLQFILKNGLPSAESKIITDREKLYAILTNLIKNAIKYTFKGLIEIGYQVQSASHDGKESSKYLKFYVKDTGLGIPNDRLNAIFDRFVQADVADKMALQGAGLGLSISKAYVEMLGGEIWVESENGKGSTFYFTIPFHSPTEEKKDTSNFKHNTNTQKGLKSISILIAEDDETSDMLITLKIEKFSKKIFHAKTGTEVLEILHQNPTIDLILMDIQMPEINGYEVTRRIRVFNKDIVIIAQTAYALAGDREKALKAGCNDHISKPIDIDSLEELIRKYI